MRKWIPVLLLFFLMTLLPAMAQQEYTIDPQTGTLKSYTGPGGDIVIPSQVDGVAVRALGPALFDQNKAITSAVLPEGLVTIEYNAFYFCENLKSVALPSTLEVVDSYAFFSCAGLEGVTLPASLHTLRGHAFQFCDSLAQVTFLGETPLIGPDAFASTNANLARVYTVPEDQQAAYENALGAPVQTQGASAPVDYLVPASDLEFDAATGTILGYRGGHTRLILPQTIDGVQVQAIGSKAFFARRDIRRVQLPEGLVSLGESAFFGTDLEEIILPGTLERIDEKALSSASLPALELPGGVKEIGREAFSFNRLAHLVLPEGLESLPEKVFSNNASLEDIVFPESLKSIGKEAFAGCSALNYMVFSGKSLPSIAQDAFLGCDKVADVDISQYGSRQDAQTARETFANLGYPADALHVWRANPKDEPPYPPNGTMTAFDPATGLISGYTGSLDSMTMYWTFDALPVRGISADTFKGAGLKVFHMPHSETFAIIGDGAFQDSQLERVYLFDSLTHIGSDAFRNCVNLKEIVIPAYVEEIGANAFAGCTALEKVVFLGGTPKIGADAFQGCTALSQVVLPAGSQPANHLGLSPQMVRVVDDASPEQIAALREALGFPWYRSLLTVSQENPFQTMPDTPNPESEFEFDADKQQVTRYIGTNPVCVIPRSIGGVEVVSLGEMVFSAFMDFDMEGDTTQRPELTYVVIPETVRNLADSSFLNLKTLQSVACYGPIDRVGIRAFENCVKLESIIFHNGVKELGIYAFNMCESLRLAELGPYIQTISEGAFFGCGFESLVMDRQIYQDFAYQKNAKVTSVHVLPTVQSIGNLMFEGMPQLKEVYFEGVPASALSSYGFHFPQDNADFKVYIPEDASEETYQAFVTLLEQNILPGESIVERKDCPVDHSAAVEEREPADEPEATAAPLDAAAEPAETAAPPAVVEEIMETAAPTATEETKETAQAPIEAAQGILQDTLYVCVKAEAGGVPVDTALIGRYEITFLSDGSAKMTIGGTEIAPVTWTGDGASATVDFFGTKYVFSATEDGLQMNYFDTMLLTYQPE